MSKEKDAAESFFKAAGVEINGKHPWDIQVHDERFYKRLLSAGSLGLGESYMEEWWDAERVDLFIEKLVRADASAHHTVAYTVKAWVLNLQSRTRSRSDIESHYDLSNELYFSFLDPYNQYTCGYFRDTDDLDTAQRQKMDLICQKLHLKPGDRVLDIGCGWGGFAKYAAERHGCNVVGITISEEQFMYATKFVEGLPVEIRMQDYRDLCGEQFDKIVIIGMIEHVGYKNYRAIMKIVHACLAQDGLFLLHTIGRNNTVHTGEPWSHKYIFPNGMLPSIKQLGQATEKLFVMEDWHNFGPYYHQTLRAWDENFRKNWPRLQRQYPERFFRMFRYYFNSFAGAFKARRIQVWQIVFSKGASERIYQSVR